MYSRSINNISRLAALVLMTLTGISVASAAKPGMRIYDQGLQEDTRVYKVICANGTRAGVSARFDLPPPEMDLKGNLITDEGDRTFRQAPTFNFTGSRKFEPKEICAHPYGKKDHCKPRWDINQAATYACKQSAK